MTENELEVAAGDMEVMGDIVELEGVEDVTDGLAIVADAEVLQEISRGRIGRRRQ